MCSFDANLLINQTDTISITTLKATRIAGFLEL